MNANTINDRATIDGGAGGTVLAGRYRVVRQLGQGGMGSVWLAEDQQLENRKVALKMLPTILVSNPRAYGQLKQEALVSLKLTHPNIAAVRAFEENDGNPFLVIDYIDGLTLDAYLARKGKLNEQDTLSILLPVAEALDYAHAKGVVHRDVKPGNVMITWDGEPYVLDFGIAREIQETMTRVTGKLSSGTLLYMSPEQLRGAAPKPAQDVYSFAALAYECLTGHPPFHRGQVEWQILNEQPEPLPPGIAMAKRVMAGLAKEAAGRPANCVLTLMDDAADESAPEGSAPAHPAAAADLSHAAPAHKPGEPRFGFQRKMNEQTALEDAVMSRLWERWKRTVFAVGAVAAVAVALLAWQLARPGGKSAAARRAGSSAEVEELYVAAEVAAGKVERISPADGYRKDIDAILDLNRQARSHFALRDWAAAQAEFVRVKEESENLLALDRARHIALAAAKAAGEAAARAQALDAVNLAGAAWEGACQTRDDAKGQYRVRKYAAATEGYNAAKRLFDETAEQARAEAEARKLPRLVLEARIDGLAVKGAKIEFGGKTYEMPVDLGVVRTGVPYGPFKVSYTKNHRWFEGAFSSLTVNWTGKRLQTFDLKERKFPKAGDRCEVVLDAATGTKMAFRWCPAGDFEMGAMATAPGGGAASNPHRVDIARGFWIGETEVTQGQWRKVMGSSLHDQVRKELQSDVNFIYNHKTQEKRPHRGFWKAAKDADTMSRIGNTDDNLPMYYVNWVEALAFCSSLNHRVHDPRLLLEGYGFRLPTEAEWEYACRAGRMGPVLPNGEAAVLKSPNHCESMERLAWYAGTSAWNYEGTGWLMTNSVARHHEGLLAGPRLVANTRANDWGVFDMLGNVEEWCLDCWQEKLEDATSPLVISDLKTRIVRGGSWDCFAFACMPWFRSARHPLWRNNDIGLRVVVGHIQGFTPCLDDIAALQADVCEPDAEWVTKENENKTPQPQPAPTPRPEAALPVVKLSATLHGQEVAARVVDGLVEPNRVTPIDVTMHSKVGTWWEFTLEYEDNGRKYRQDCSCMVSPGVKKLQISLDKGVLRNDNLNFCRHCRFSLQQYVTIGNKCPSCNGKLYGPGKVVQRDNLDSLLESLEGGNRK